MLLKNTLQKCKPLAVALMVCLTLAVTSCEKEDDSKNNNTTSKKDSSYFLTEIDTMYHDTIYFHEGYWDTAGIYDSVVFDYVYTDTANGFRYHSRTHNYYYWNSSTPPRAGVDSPKFIKSYTESKYYYWDYRIMNWRKD